MDKRKLVNIIVKDLEELKILSEEVADSQEDSSLIVDLALNRARLLCQEFELLRELAGNSVSIGEETEDDNFIEENDEISDISFSDPELEILNFEESEFPVTEEFSEDDEILVDDEPEEDINEDVDEDEDGEDKVVEDFTDDMEEEDNEDDLTEFEDDEDLDEDLTEEMDDEDLTEEDGDLTEEDEEFDDEEEDEVPSEDLDGKSPQINQIDATELQGNSQSEIREIHIDDSDDDIDMGSIRFSPSGSTGRPPMREIPKPENPVIGETFQKDRSLNDAIGGNKSMESKLTNSPIVSLRAAIGLNDRFIFIREIFNNNSDKYNMVIDQLDKMEHIQQAVEYLKANLRMEKNEASLKFVDLLKRRFTK